MTTIYLAAILITGSLSTPVERQEAACTAQADVIRSVVLETAGDEEMHYAGHMAVCMGWE
jgi:hypothetical protein